MKRIGKYFFLMTVLLMLGACKNTVDHKGKTPLVEAGGSFLYQEDLLASMPVGLHGEDSVHFAQKYIRNWIEDALLYQKAEGNIPENVKIDELVASYRRALIMHTYQEELVKQKVGAEITDAEIAQYYTQNTGMFRADQPYLKGLFIKVPLNVPHLKQVRTWYKSNTQESIDKLEKFSIGNAVSYDYFYDRWQPLSEVAAKLPLKELDTNPNYPDRNRNIEVRDTAFCYLLHVEDFLPKGELLPLEFAKSEIKEILINLKRVNFVNKMKQDLYNEASEDNDIIYYYSNE